jgi:hypothetical protein
MPRLSMAAGQYARAASVQTLPLQGLSHIELSGRALLPFVRDHPPPCGPKGVFRTRPRSLGLSAADPTTIILFHCPDAKRAGHHGDVRARRQSLRRVEATDWTQDDNTVYIFGLAGNAVLDALVAEAADICAFIMRRVARRSCVSFMYKAGSWLRIPGIADRCSD